MVGCLRESFTAVLDGFGKTFAVEIGRKRHRDLRQGAVGASHQSADRFRLLTARSIHGQQLSNRCHHLTEIKGLGEMPLDLTLTELRTRHSLGCGKLSPPFLCHGGRPSYCQARSIRDHHLGLAFPH